MKPTQITPAPTAPVACFAPPLTDELLARYLGLIEALPDGPIRSAMQACYNCADAWWNARESTKSFKERWRTGGGQTYDIIPFDDELIKELDAVTPWSYEVEAMQALFLTIQADEVARNSERLDAWQRALHEYVISKSFPDPEVFRSLQKNRRSLQEALPLLSEADQAKLRDTYRQVDAVVAEIHAAIHAKSHPQVPRPTLEPTTLRDAAGHLLWFAEQITRDREPPTQDKLTSVPALN